jgi:hypothetical protein
MQYEGNFSVIETKAGSGEFKFAPAPDGKFEDASGAIAAILKAKVNLSGWAVWFDGDGWDKIPAKGKPVTASALASFVKRTDEAEMVMVRRPFPQLKVKLTKGKTKFSGNGKATRQTL